MKARIVKQPVVELPDGTILLTFWIVNEAGHRIGKYSGDLRRTSADVIQNEAAIRSLQMSLETPTP